MSDNNVIGDPHTNLGKLQKNKLIILQTPSNGMQLVLGVSNLLMAFHHNITKL